MRKPRVAFGLLLAAAAFHDAAGYAQAPPAGPTFDVGPVCGGLGLMDTTSNVGPAGGACA